MHIKGRRNIFRKEENHMADNKKATAPKKAGKGTQKKTTKTAKKRNRIILIAVEAAVIVVALLAAVIIAVMDKKGGNQGAGSNLISADVKKENLNVQEENKVDGFWNIALFGVDSRTGVLGKGTLSDCIIVCSINKETKEVKLVSIYRDTYLNIPGYGLDKVNHAYAFGGPALSMSTINTN